MAVESRVVRDERVPELQTAADVRLDRVTKRFDDVLAVDDVSLEIERGSFFALLGPSGCGKTTSLRMIGGFEEPTAGTIYLGDQDVTGRPPYRRDVNTVFQSYALFPHLTIFENVAFGLRRQGVKGRDARGRVTEILRLVGLSGMDKRKPRQLSGGQQQRVALARALVNKPRVLLLDEPLGALDLKLRKHMQLELKAIQHDVGITFVHVTHDQEEAMTMADRIAIMNAGRIEQLGTPSDLYEQPETAFVAGFLGISNLLAGTVSGPDLVRLGDGTEVRVPPRALDGRSGRVAVGVRPEKIRLGHGEENRLSGRLLETAYVGVATQYVLETRAGNVSVYVQNSEPGARQEAPSEISWSPDSTFVVDSTEGAE
jgi:spermidine/putrescine transport system ATP-binding protein